ncbi:MAG: hypothetical protein JJT93_14200 [Gammaproteobacteria bacterium]|nr:hypothetical protein [Gammaproteobacteria bacterium]
MSDGNMLAMNVWVDACPLVIRLDTMRSSGAGHRRPAGVHAGRRQAFTADLDRLLSRDARSRS